MSKPIERVTNRPIRRPLANQGPLAISDDLISPGHVGFWANMTANKVEQLLDAGYRIVNVDRNKQDRKLEFKEDHLNSAVIRIVDEKNKVKAILLEIHEELHAEYKKLASEVVDSTEEGMNDLIVDKSVVLQKFKGE